MEENDFFWFKQGMEENDITQPDIFHSNICANILIFSMSVRINSKLKMHQTPHPQETLMNLESVKRRSNIRGREKGKMSRPYPIYHHPYH